MHLKISILGIVFSWLLLQTNLNAQTDLANTCGDITATTTLPINDCSSPEFRVGTANWSGIALGACSSVSGANIRDGWAGFTSLSGGDNRVVVQYNHTPPPITNTAFTVYNDCATGAAGTQIAANTGGAFNISQTVTPVLITYAGVTVTVQREGWIRYTAQAGEKFSITYSNTNQNAALAVYQGGCPGTGTFAALRNDVNGVGTESVTLTNTTAGIQTYDIQVMNIESDNPMSGTLKITQHNALLMVYTGTCGGTLDLLSCSVSDNDGTQSITFNAAPSTTYYVRVVNLFSNGANMDGNLCVFSGPAQPGDLCNEAQEVSIGTCDYQIEIFSSFFNNENIANPLGCGITEIFRDGWARFDVTNVNQRIGIEYQSEITDVALAVYGGSCSDLTLIECANNVITSGTDQKEYLEFTAPSIGTYYVRIMNIENTQTVVGKICLYNVIPRNNCTDAVASAVSLNLGDCNVKANIPANFTPSGFAACAPDNNDIWMRYTHTDASVTSVQVEYIADGASTVYNPNMIIYNAAPPFDCASLGTSPNIICASSGLPANTLVASFAVTAGQTYYIRIINQASNEMIGNICIYDQGKKAEDNFYTALQYQIDGTDCGKQFNILSSFNATGGAALATPLNVSCATESSQIDAWAKFQTGAALPTNDLVIEYNNDNQDADIADNAALVVYKGSPINAPVSTTPDRIATTSGGATTALVFDTFHEGITVPTGSVWARISIPAPGTYSLVFEAGAIDAFTIRDSGVNYIADFPNNSPVTFSAAGTYFIEIVNIGAEITGGRFAVFSPLTEIGCANALSEGTESVTLTSTTPNFDPNSTYYIRVINLESENSLVGTLCIRNGGVRPEDLCSTARPIVVGDCDILFNLLETDLPDNQPLAPSCIGSKTLQSDAWASFTANTSQTTLEYFISGNVGKDAAVEIYRGSCAGLISVACADALGQIDGVESVAFNTLVGQTYYIRMMNVGTTGDMLGRICLFDTRERDVCDDQDIITLTPDACNVRFNIPATFRNTGAATNGSGACSGVTFGADSRDAWIRFLGDGTNMTIQYQNGETTSDPMLMIYTANPGPVNCGIGIYGAGNSANEVACRNIHSTGQQTESVSILTQAGKLYILRVVDLNVGAMTGTLCIFSGETGADDCAAARVIDIRSTLGSPEDVGACNIQFNVLNTNTASAPTAGCIPAITNQGDAWATFTTGLGGVLVFPLPANNITVQYDNNDNNFTAAPDVVLEVYRENGTFDCTDPSTYDFVGCIDTAVEGVESLNFPVTINASETYYIRIINKDPAKTSFGKLCIFFGPTIARENCATTLDYGPLDGTYKGFEVASTWTDRRPQTSIQDPVCVIPNGSNPSSPNPPIVSNGWVRFNVPINVNPDLQVNAVTVQFDNTRFSSTDLNSENAAIAVYRLLPPNTPESINNDAAACTLSNLELVDCANNVWRGTESVTISVVPGGNYLVRVMNVKNSGKNMPGLVRVFEFVRCELQGELVVDGNFANWKALNTASNPNPSSFAGTQEWIHENPDIRRYNKHSNDQQNIDFYARFATDYGYLRDVAGGSGGDDNSQRRLFAAKGEFNPEGLYSVTHTMNNYKTNWFSYGNGEVGYGGGNSWNFSAAYCATGGAGVGSEACEGFGVPSAGLPALIPNSAEANFMAINGWWKKPADYPNQEAGKIWCQTIDISGNAAVPNRYYVFTAWFNNVKSINQSGDVPQLRITVCDMEDVNNPGVLPAEGATSLTPLSRLPGTTYTTGVYTQHIPEPPDDANMRKAAPLGFAFGAAMPCNTDGEAPNSRLKSLGSDFFLPQEPDQWQVVRCIYRAPLNVTELNLCFENLSLSKNGNDFAIDDISFQQCSSNNEAALDALLRGDACELADEPEALGISLSMRMLDFGGRLVNDKVLLSWLTLNENNLTSYEVQRSTDGATFYAIGQVEARGGLNELQSYDFVDYQLPEGRSVIYYRLRMIGANNNDQLGAIIQVNLENLQDLEMLLHPNPIQAGDDFKLSFKAFGNLAGIKISDMMGNVKTEKIISTQEGKNELTFSSKGFAPGLYIIQLKVGNQQVSRKMIVM